MESVLVLTFQKALDASGESGRGGRESLMIERRRRGIKNREREGGRGCQAKNAVPMLVLTTGRELSDSQTTASTGSGDVGDGIMFSRLAIQPASNSILMNQPSQETSQPTTIQQVGQPTSPILQPSDQPASQQVDWASSTNLLNA
ncbi:hypothetical protein IF1G_07800 [Cordyceps javanica]|uniref:Uncharacterized protein n=1 Tax=Cordyceps javanica TaxID=43265 RepID=A0A545UUT8_9HYPO|nr:hypothetical protein IF1G_07800 [Cordyceps javanica]